MEQPLFDDAESALKFAFNYSGGNLPETPLAKLIKGTPGSGGNLSGIDGAAQAGMISALLAHGLKEQEVAGLTPGQQCFVAARFLSHSTPCDCRSPCCVGYRRSMEWDAAVNWIAEQALCRLSGCISNVRLRRGIVARYFGQRINIGELAEHCRVSRDRASDHNGKMVGWLKEQEGRARAEATALLQIAGIVKTASDLTSHKR